MWVRHPNGLKWDLMIWPRTTEPTKAGNNNPSSQLFSGFGRPSSTYLTTLQGIWSSWRLVSIGSSTACGWRQRYRVPTSTEMPKAPCRKWKQKSMELGMWKGLCIEKWSILKALSHFHWFLPQEHASGKTFKRGSWRGLPFLRHESSCSSPSCIWGASFPCLNRFWPWLPVLRIGSWCAPWLYETFGNLEYSRVT